MTNAAIATRSAPIAPTTAVLFGAVFIGALVLVLGLRPWGFVHHDTSEVVMWGHSGWAAGFWKHPPLLPWLTRGWSYLLPMGPASLAVLTALNITLCAGAVWQLAAMAGDDSPNNVRDRGMLAILLLATIPYATFMAIKLNHNAILISLWPLTTLAFLRALDRPTALRGALFGVAAAAAVLAKYYSLLLLAGCLAASLATPARALRFYRAPAPYVTIAAFVAAMASHALWVLGHPSSPLGYAFSGGINPVTTDLRGPIAALSFAIQSPLVLLPMAIAAGLLWRFGRASDAPAQAHRFEREIVVLALVPYLLTAIVVAAFNLRGPVAWAMPVFLCLPAVAAARIGILRHGLLPRLGASAAVILAIVAGAGQIGVRQAVSRGVDGISDPRRDIAETATQLWHKATGGPLALVGGDPRLTSGTVVFSPDRPQGWPSFNLQQAPWVTPDAVAKSGFAGLCRQSDGNCIAAAEQAARGQAILRCPLERRVSHLGASGPAFRAVLILALPATSLPAGLQCPAE
jgi:Dolichyl-phosphate-mannose-protein mannosyltransferase